jgi:hypothetical protein
MFVKIGALLAVGAASLVLAPTLSARSVTGMAAMQYYVGTWSCIGGAIDKQPFHFTVRYTEDAAILQIWVQAAKGYVQSGSLRYDSKNDRYVEAAVANDDTWFVAYRTISGNTETSVDHATSDGKLGRLVTVRTSGTSFTSTTYPGLSGGKAVLRWTCQKS